MKANATILVDVNTMTIHSIDFDDRVLNTSNTSEGRIRLMKFLKKRIIQMPLCEFKPFSGGKIPGANYLGVNVEIDIYPLILKKKLPIKKITEYKCELFPVPTTKKSDVDFEDYYKLQLNGLDSVSKNNHIL